MNKKRENILKYYPKQVSVVTLLIVGGIYFLIGYINGNYPTNENQSLFQTIYFLLAVLAFGSFALQAMLVKRYNTTSWKLLSIIFSVISFIVFILGLIGIASVNFF